MKHDIILFLIQFFLLKMVKKFLLEMLSQDFQKKLLRLKILQVVYQELLNYLKQEKLKIVLSLLKMMDKLYLVKRLEENKEYLLFQRMVPNLQII